MNAENAYSGFLNVLKPPGMTSAHVVSIVRRLFHGEKTGHAGTLDPEAAGVLPLMIGKAARLFDDMQDKQKTYITEVAFGCTTDTQDAQGTVLTEGECFPAKEELLKAMEGFRGEIMQTPPMFSALKQNGQRLYDLARAGKEADIPARPVTVHSLELIDIMPEHGALLRVTCSKGFYVRTLCQDLGTAVGCPSHMRFLLRTESGPFNTANAHTLEELFQAEKEGRLQKMLLEPREVLPRIPEFHVPDRLRKAVINGLRLWWKDFAPQGEVENGGIMALEMDGKWCAVAHRYEDTVRIRTWIG